MTRHVILVAATALALILVPTAAGAYSPSLASHEPGSSFAVSDATPAAGAAFGAVVSGTSPNEPVTLTITTDPASISNSAIRIGGAKALSMTATASGVASFAVVLTEAGVYALTATAADGDAIGTKTVTVAASGAAPGAASGAAPGAASGAAPGAASGAAPGAGEDGQISPTGLARKSVALGFGVLVLIGAGAFLAARSRRSARSPA